jgi:cobalt-zinc-cadmium efflux system outer membrane protein
MQKTILALALVSTSLLAIPQGVAQTGETVSPAITLDQSAPPSLSSSLQAVMQSHPRLQAAKASLEATSAHLRAADKALYNPEFELDVEQAEIDKGYIQIGQTLDLRNQRGARTQVAEAELAGAKAEFLLAIQGLSRDLLVALAKERTARELVKLANQGLELMRQFADISEQRYKAGDINQVDLDLARLAYNESLMVHAKILAEAAAARQELHALFVNLPAPLPELPESMPKPELPQELETFIRTLPVMRVREAQVAATRHTIKLRESERSWDPTIALRGGKEEQESLIGATITIPLNIRNTYEAEVDVARQNLIENEHSALMAYRKQRATVLASTEQYQLLRNAWQNWDKTGRISINRQLNLIERLWRAGDMSTAEYLVQLNQALSTQSAGLELRGRLWKSGFDWLYETASIDTWLDINIKKQD